MDPVGTRLAPTGSGPAAEPRGSRPISEHDASPPDDDPLAIAFDPDELASRSAASGAVMLGSHAIRFVLGVASTMALARLLTPRDFGLFFMVTALLAFVGSFRDFGFPMATVASERIGQRRMSALFWLNVRLTGLVLVFMLAMAPVLAWFFREGRLTVLTAVLAVGVVVNSLGSLHLGLLRRQMRFVSVTAADLGAYITGVVVAIIAALLGAGYWALALQHIVSHAGQAVGWFVASRWRPSRVRRGEVDLSGMRRYGRDVTLARVIAHLGRNLDRILVGRVAGASPLGLYQNAYRWSILPVEQVFQPLLTVVVATFSRVRDEIEEYRAYFRSAVRGVAALTLPVLSGLFVEAEAFILVLLGDQWVEAIPLFRILVVGAFVGGVNQIAKWVWYSEGTTDRQLRWALISTPVMVAGVGVGAFWGATGVAVGFTAGMLALCYPTVRYAMATSPLGQRDVWEVVTRPVIGAVIAAAVTATVGGTVGLPDHDVFRLVVAALVHIVAYASVWLATPAGRRDLDAMLVVLRLLRSSAASR